MAISDFRAYFKRKYKKDGEWFTEEEKEISQINRYTGTGYPPYKEDEIYQAYLENMLPVGSTGLSGRNYNGLGYGVYAAYEPGLIFLSEYYNILDLFTNGDFALISYIVENSPTQITVLNKSYQYYYINNSNIFWQNDDGYNILPYFYFNISASSLTQYTWYGGIGYFCTLLDPSVITYNTEENKFYSNEGGVLTEISLTSDLGNRNTVLKFSGKGSIRDISSTYQRFHSQLIKIKIYPLFVDTSAAILWDNVNVNNVKYFRSNFNTKTTSLRNYFSFIYDVSKCPYFQVPGFIAPDMSLFSNYLSKIDKSNGGPDPSDPGHIDDPNDEDPGHGPGEDPGDTGGDGDHDNGSDEVEPPSLPPISGSGISLYTVFNPSTTQLRQIASKLWSPGFIDVFKQYFTSPMEAIIGLSIVPVQPQVAENRNVYFGKYNTEVSAPVVTSDYVVINCGSIAINRYWGSYLDYDPYTKIYCYLPYIGEVDINADQVMQKNLGILYYVNIITGDIVAVLTIDGSVFMTAAGNCNRQLPMSQSDYSSIINTAVSAIGTLASGVAGAGIGSAIAGAASTPAATEVANARITATNVGTGSAMLGEVMNTKFHYQHAGQIGTGSGQLGPQKPFLIIERPNLDLADNYKSYVGYPCNKTLLLAACSGFTQVESIKVSIDGATNEEICEIDALLKEGVFI